MNRRITLLAAACALALVSLAGCGKSHRDAPRVPDADTHPGTHAQIIQEPDGFRNVSFSCFGTTGVYVTSAAASGTLPSGIALLPNDPACK